MISKTTINEFYEALCQEYPDTNLDIGKAEEILLGLVRFGDTLAKVAHDSGLTAIEVNSEEARSP